MQYTKFQASKPSGSDWLVGCFGFNGPLRQYFSLYRAVSQREGERRERIDESKNVQTTPTRTYCKRNRPLPYCNQNCRTPRHWKFTQHHRTTRPPQQVVLKKIFLIYFYGSNLGPLARGHLGLWDLHLNKLGRGALGNATYPISNIWAKWF